MSAVINLDEASFQTTIQSGVTLVDFWTPWCGPCKKQGPILEELAETIGDKATIAKVDVDQFSSIAMQFDVRSVPTIIVLKEGNVVQTFVGVQQKQTLVETINTALRN